MAGSSDRLAFFLWEAPLLNNKPLRLFLKTGRCHTKYATHVSIFLQAVPPLSGAFVISLCRARLPSQVLCMYGAKYACVGERSTLRCGQKEKPFAQKCKGL